MMKKEVEQLQAIELLCTDMLVSRERHNGLLRRFIPKGEPISGYSAEDILFISDWANGLPRKILGYHTPEEPFEKEMDRIFAA